MDLNNFVLSPYLRSLCALHLIRGKLAIPCQNRDVSKASAASSAAPINSQMGVLRKPVLGSLIKRNHRRRADRYCLSSLKPQHPLASERQSRTRLLQLL